MNNNLLAIATKAKAVRFSYPTSPDNEKMVVIIFYTDVEATMPISPAIAVSLQAFQNWLKMGNDFLRDIDSQSG